MQEPDWPFTGALLMLRIYNAHAPAVPMKFTNAFLARYATRAPSGVWAGDSFVSTWQAASLPEQATLAIVWTCTFEDAEFGNAFTFEFSMTDPAETVEVFGNTVDERRRARHRGCGGAVGPVRRRGRTKRLSGCRRRWRSGSDHSATASREHAEVRTREQRYAGKKVTYRLRHVVRP